MAPITAIFTIFELTYNFEIILPLITSCIASLIIVKKFYGNSIYETKLLKRGIKIVRGHDVNLLRSIPVTQYMDREYEKRPDRHRSAGIDRQSAKKQVSSLCRLESQRRTRRHAIHAGFEKLPVRHG